MKSLRTINARCMLAAGSLVGLFLGSAWLDARAEESSESKVDLERISRETMQVWSKNQHVICVWWMPEEYLRAVSEYQQAPAAQTEQSLKLLHPYLLVGVVESKEGDSGTRTYESEASIRNRLRVLDRSRNAYSPLPNSDCPSELLKFLENLKPRVAGALGPFGGNLNFYLFRATDKAGRPIADAKSEDNFSVRIGDEELRWRLPLSSIMPAKLCPKCGEKLSGTFKFCPYDGTALAK